MVKEEHCVLNEFLNHEASLHLLSAMKHVFAWHAILFEVFGPASISREEANSISNQDVVNRFPVDRRAFVQATLDNYCQGFNESFGIVERLFECQENPFLTPSGEVDLSGCGGATGKPVPMSASTPIAFSVPSVR